MTDVSYSPPTKEDYDNLLHAALAVRPEERSKWKITYGEIVRSIGFLLRVGNILAIGASIGWIGIFWGAQVTGVDQGYLEACTIFAPEYDCEKALFLRKYEGYEGLKQTKKQNGIVLPPSPPSATINPQEVKKLDEICEQLNAERGKDTYLAGSADRIAFKYHCLSNNPPWRAQ